MRRTAATAWTVPAKLYRLALGVESGSVNPRLSAERRVLQILSYTDDECVKRIAIVRYRMKGVDVYIIFDGEKRLHLLPLQPHRPARSVGSRCRPRPIS